MANPREVFDDPGNYLSFLISSSDNDFESQYFDRKEAGRVLTGNSISQSNFDGIISQIKECVSAFANGDGGLLVLGISSNGAVKGIQHLSENQLNRITSLNQLLKCQTVSIKFFDCTNDQGIQDKFLLFLVHKSENGICETITANPEAWLRVGPQNQPMTNDMRELLKREKRITDFERGFCCLYDPAELDPQVIAEFKRAMSPGLQISDQDLLYNAGALEKDTRGALFFNNAGFLFFSNNPSRVLSWAYVRLLRFNAKVSEFKNPGLPTFDQIFEGPLPQQIRKLRVHFRESGFIKIYQKRNPDGGFIEEPELPRIAIDEAIVNGVIHRDYGVQIPIECRLFRDGLVVENPGRINQRGQALPIEFSLSDISLDSSPRNSKLMQWMRSIRDDQGAVFVQALSEGTKRMRDEMILLNLPAPLYNTEPKRTILILYSNAEEREKKYQQSKNQNNPEFANIFPIQMINDQGNSISSDYFDKRYKEIVYLLRDALQAKGWYVDDISFSRITAHRKGIEIPLPSQVAASIRFYPAYIFQIREFYNKFFLSIDYTLAIKNISRVSELLKHFNPEKLQGKRCISLSNNWATGRITSCSLETTCVHFDNLGTDEYIPSNNVIPDLPMDLIKLLVKEKSPQFDLPKEIKRHSIALDPNSSRHRAEKTITTINEISQQVFPLTMGDITLKLLSVPISLNRFDNKSEFPVIYLPEPIVEFHHQQETPDIRNGITRFGSYQDDQKFLELIPICLTNYRDHMAALIERLKVGKYKYSGSEKTFSTRLTYSTILTVQSPEEILNECKRIITEHPDWIGNPQLSRLFLVHTPESGYSLDNEVSPYYLVKRYLLENGIPCQMIDTPTLQNPDWKDLNLALNVIAKCGVTPWVLPDRIPDTDFFVGLSFTQNRRNGLRRLLGYATVFNQFGKWEFYTGNTDTFSYDERETFFDQLTQQTLNRLVSRNSLSDRPNISFHYSAKFSYDDRKTILQAARKVRPNGTYSFVSINSHHNIRLYDNRPETDGSLSRGCYIPFSQRGLFLSTTGYNPYRKAIGTPKPLEISIRVEPPINEKYVPSDLKALASQILSLTKLNWASTDSICGEPITTKYAGDIAYLTDAFLRQTGTFKLHPVLERTPWFI
jgi:predicted HTH transcriptional regulator